jgi:hypothetical protein
MYKQSNLDRVLHFRRAAAGARAVAGARPFTAKYCSILIACTLLCLAASLYAEEPSSRPLPLIKVSDDKTCFVRADTAERFVVWGVNYDHDAAGRLLDDYWIDEWETVVADFQEIKQLGANVVRIHPQFGRLMDAADQPNDRALQQLKKVVELAESQQLYLDITGLGCYHKQDVPAWYDALSEADRWRAQACCWQAIARACRESNAIFCYDLMNEPVVGGAEQGKADWLAGELAGKYFVQRIALDLGDRDRLQVAHAWVKQLSSAIREEDPRHLITVGVIPWAHVWPNAKPIFYSEPVAAELDFVSVHFYPVTGEVDKALTALKVYDIGKPIVVEEMFPLKCSADELLDFVDRSREFTDGWISFYWGKPASEYDQTELTGVLIAAWLKAFQQKSAEMLAIQK